MKIENALDTLAAARRDLKTARTKHAGLVAEQDKTTRRLASLRAELKDFTGPAQKAEALAARIGAVDLLAREQGRRVTEAAAAIDEAQAAVNDAETALAHLRQQRRDGENRLARWRSDRQQIVRQAAEAQALADRQRQQLARHDAGIKQIEAELADLAEPEPEQAA